MSIRKDTNMSFLLFGGLFGMGFSNIHLYFNLPDKNKFVMHIRHLKKTLNRGLVYEKVYGVIIFNQQFCLIPYIDRSTVKKQSKIVF